MSTASSISVLSCSSLQQVGAGESRRVGLKLISLLLELFLAKPLLHQLHTMLTSRRRSIKTKYSSSLRKSRHQNYRNSPNQPKKILQWPLPSLRLLPHLPLLLPLPPPPLQQTHLSNHLETQHSIEWSPNVFSTHHLSLLLPVFSALTLPSLPHKNPSLTCGSPTLSSFPKKST